MKAFVIRENIRHFRHLLAEPLPPGQRATVEQLLADAEAALASLPGSEHLRPIYEPLDDPSHHR